MICSARMRVLAFAVLATVLVVSRQAPGTDGLGVR